MSIQFATGNPFDDGYDNGLKRSKALYDATATVGVDNAVRAGIKDMLGSETSQPPAQQPQPQPAQPTIGPAARTLAQRTQAVEDPSGTAVNPGGYTGRYQVGTAALQSAGAYEPAAGEDLKTNQWRGTIVLPKAGRLTHEQFRTNQAAQDEAWDMHQANLTREMNQRNFSRYIGGNAGGLPLTEDALRSMMHFGGPGGTQRFLETGGQYNPKDANGVSLSDYAMKIDRGAAVAPQQPTQPQQAMPTLPGAPNMNPILTRLADVPGGGAAALKLLQDKKAGDRQVAYQKLAMQALGKGDADVARYYAAAGGLNLPDSIFANGDKARRLATGSLLAHRIYGDDPAAGARFAQAYMQTGDAEQAFALAGEPQGKPYKMEWVRRDEKELAMMFNPRTRQMEPVQGPDGAPLSRDAKPAGGRVADRQIRLNMLKAAGLDDQTANAVAAGIMPTPAAIISAYGRVHKTIGGNPFIKPHEQEAAINQSMDAMFGDMDWRSVMQGRIGQAAPSLPTPPVPPAQQPMAQRDTGPAAPPQRPMSVPAGSQYSPSRKQWRDPQGNLYDENGMRAQRSQWQSNGVNVP